jgi:hypothetical protein
MKIASLNEVRAGRIELCLSEKKRWIKHKIIVISNIYNILPHLTAFDSSPQQNVCGAGKAGAGIFLKRCDFKIYFFLQNSRQNQFIFD